MINKITAAIGLLAVFFDPSLANATYTQQTTAIMAASSCARYSWKSRGKAPAGYIKGMGLSFARSLCRVYLVPPNGLAALMSRAATANTSKDALAHYKSQFTSNQIRTDIKGPEALRALYTLGIGLGMRESSGAYCEGWDTSAGSNRPSNEAEAGLFQASYNSMGASKFLKELYSEYLSDPNRCHLGVFKEGVSCRAQKVLGTGAGAAYQTFTKSCPAFAAEYALSLLRVLRAHFGPINRREAEISKSCNAALLQVQNLVEGDTTAACSELL